MKIKVKDGGLIHRMLTEPTLREVDIYYANLSPFTFEPCEDPMHEQCAKLSPLGVLNGMFGLELQLKESASLDSSAEDSASSSA